jgi:hypothetical protein
MDTKKHESEHWIALFVFIREIRGKKFLVETSLF